MSSLITRFINDITQIQMVIAMGLMILIRTPIMAAWTVTKIADKNWEWSVVTVAVVVIVLLTIGIVILYVISRFRRIQRFIDNLNRVTCENFSRILIINLLSLTIYWVEVVLIDQADPVSAVGNEAQVLFLGMVVFTSYAMQIVISFIMTIIILMILSRIMVESKHIQEVIDTEPSSGTAIARSLSRRGQLQVRRNWNGIR